MRKTRQAAVQDAGRSAANAAVFLATMLLSLAIVLFTLMPRMAQSAPLPLTITGPPDDVRNCIPFGCPGPDFTGFIYRALPAFSVKPGDSIAFDTLAPNNVELRFDIYIAPADPDFPLVPLGFQDAGKGFADLYTKIVDGNAGHDQFGNAVDGDFDLAYRLNAGFDFDGGGLIILLRAVGVTAGDLGVMDGDGKLIPPTEFNLRASDRSAGAGPTDYFVGRFYGDTNGLPEYEDVHPAFVDFCGSEYPSPLPVANSVPRGGSTVGVVVDCTSIAHFQLRAAPEPGMCGLFGLALLGAALARRRRA